MESKRYEVKGENGTYGVFVQSQSEPVEIELWNNIEKIVGLKRDIPDLDAGGAIHLIESEITRMKNKQKSQRNDEYNRKLKNYVENTKSVTQQVENENTLYKIDHSMDKHPELIKIGTRVEEKYSTLYENNSWGIPVNTYALCEKCKMVSILGLAIHHDDGATIVYKTFEHSKGERRQHFVRLRKFDGEISYKQIQRIVRNEENRK